MQGHVNSRSLVMDWPTIELTDAAILYLVPLILISIVCFLGNHNRILFRQKEAAKGHCFVMNHHHQRGRSRLPQAPWVLKYEALLAGMKRAKCLQVKHLLAEENSRLLFHQVVGRWNVKESHLRDHLRKVWVMSKELDSLFVAFIPKDQNVHANRIASAAIVKEIQIQEVVTDYLDRSRAWSSPSPLVKEPDPVSPPERGLSPFSKLRPVSPLPSKGASKPSAHVMFHGDDVQTSESTKADRFWHGDPHRLSISDESSTSVGEAEESLPEKTPGPAASVAGPEDAHDEAQEFCKPAPCGAQHSRALRRR